MAQYQSFPGAAGDSHTLDKLKALLMPDLEGRSFLDVGCNEGFFCGFAHWLGASRSVGIDHSRHFIERARRRFPDCEFFQQGWETLPDGSFDVILLASAIHYADDQPALLHRLVERLSPDGVLILELGIASSQDSEWVKVKRGIDERYFPSMPKLREVLEDYAWKWMGPSVAQAGDPVPRHVVHISRKRPMAYLLMQPPAYGKTSIAGSLFAPGHVQVLSGDEMLDQVARGKLAASPELARLVTAGYSPFLLDRIVARIFEQGLGPDLVDLWLAKAAGESFALDAFIPAECHAQVERMLSAAGYLPVQLRWERPGPRLLAADVLAERGEAFYLSMDDVDQEGGDADARRAPRAALGFVDEMVLTGSRLVVRGWAVNESGALPAGLVVKAGGLALVPERFERQMRTDVQRHLGLSHALVGYRFEVEVADPAALGRRREPPAVFAMEDRKATGSAFRQASTVPESWGRVEGKREQGGVE